MQSQSRGSLVIHYHRTQGDHHRWDLFLSASQSSPFTPIKVISPVCESGVTSFGTAFRIPLSALSSCSISVLPTHAILGTDNPPRLLTVPTTTSSDLHIFIVQGDSAVYGDPFAFELPSIASPRFVGLSLSDSSSNPWIVLLNGGTKCELFPVSSPFRDPQAPPLYLLDQAVLAGSAVSIATVVEHSDAVCIAGPSNKHATLDLPVTSASRIQLRRDDNGNLQLHPDLTTTPLPLLLAAQADRCPSLSIIRSAPSTIPPPECVHVPPKGKPLRVYLKQLGRNVYNVKVDLLVTDSSRMTLLPQRLETLDDGRPIFDVNLVKLSPEKISKGLRIVPVVGGKIGTAFLWTPEMGLDVVLAESFSELIKIEHVNLSVMYHRFGDFEDWNDWELHVWTEANDRHPAYSTMLKPERSILPGIARFNFDGYLFPCGAVVRAEPVRMALFPGRMLTNEHGEQYQGEPYTDALRRDVVREWVSGSAPAAVLHFLQGHSEVLTDAPLAADMRYGRKFRLRYRRYLPEDYDEWDLWTWDESDPENNRIAVAPMPDSITRAWVDFEIDRARYGAGASISLVPRKNREMWSERDEPTRVWRNDMCNRTSRTLDVALVTDAPSTEIGGECPFQEDFSVPMFTIVQGSSLILRKLEEVKSMMTAYVDSEESIIIASPVPVAWVSPPNRGRSQAISDTVVRVCSAATNGFRSADGHIEDDTTGIVLPIRKFHEVAPTQFRLTFNEKAVRFEEDFLIENVSVTVPGFDSVRLTWRIHEDWDKYHYTGTLGWEYEVTKCSFKCFAPTADNMYVILYNSPHGKEGRRAVPMRRIPEGCWKAIVEEDLKGKYYKLRAGGENPRLFPGVEVIDPYSRCNTSHTGRGLIFGFEKTAIQPGPCIPASETIIYELHVRDLTIDENSSVIKRGKFLGVTERGTKMKAVSSGSGTGDTSAKPLTPWKQELIPTLEVGMQSLDKFSSALDHIVQMGVNTIQILPIQDFDNDENDDSSYGWGYMPVHFNSPDGWYASSTSSVARVTEFKQLVDAVHKAGLKVIMDVVYNHTAEDSNEYNLDARFSFNGLAPRYYYRTCGNTPVAYTGDSTCAMRKPDEPRCGACYSNGSGCGNELRSESPMGRKFIIDSLKYWVTEYKVDGFRFDLLGLIDVDTLEMAGSELRQINPNVMIYGEPWAGGLSPIRITAKGCQRSRGFGVFNNTFRDAIRGSPFGTEETFVMDGSRLTEIKGGIIGSVDDFCDFPTETVNYVECHDNYTLWDHFRFYIRSRTDDIVFTENDMRRMHRLAAAIVFTSQGIPFMQLGQEMCRTKFDVENSYESPDKINMVRWEAKQSEWTTVQYYRGLILLRRAHPELFCKSTADEIHEGLVFYEDLGLAVPERCIGYRILGNSAKLYQRLLTTNPDADYEALREESMKWTEVVVLLNPTPSQVVFELPDHERDAIWVEVVDATHSGTRGLRMPMIGAIEVQGRSACVLRRASEREEVDLQLRLRLNSISDCYSSFHGDDPITKYAVGLSSQRSEKELEDFKRLKALRERFEEQRVRLQDNATFVPSPKMTEANAIETLDHKHGEHHKQSKSQPSPGPAAS
ncbi:Pullulanase, Pul1 [Chondrus crispus]|uniref:Pullulanase, Pul1 n=1 Tax=Chondrus crispus TaxID=2769 RepID=R7Q3N6_CHOCR|nr:Pullulanase, Pul1 [Chondrus crispus]CDF32090.1 Pullulanase, Pul1 [Chondrus crispus]|eukprot:XP_005711755.1 Pullulanase, Pul1 [Chondrus crispus]